MSSDTRFDSKKESTTSRGKSVEMSKSAIYNLQKNYS